MESSGEWKHGRERKGWREATGRMWRGVEKHGRKRKRWRVDTRKIRI